MSTTTAGKEVVETPKALLLLHGEASAGSAPTAEASGSRRLTDRR